jgi:hypothetical protein
MELDQDDRVVFSAGEEAEFGARLSAIMAHRFSGRPLRWVIYTGRHEDPRHALQRLHDCLFLVQGSGDIAFCIENLELILDQLAECDIRQVS